MLFNSKNFLRKKSKYFIPKNYLNYTKVLQKDTISDNIKNTEYAVRGKIPQRGEEIMKEIIYS